MHPTYALYVAHDITVVWDGHHIKVPETPAGSGSDLVVLLGRFSAIAEAKGLSEMTVLLDRDIVRQLGFPAKPPKTVDAAKVAPVLTRPRSHGWEIDSLSPWMSLRRNGKPTIHVGIGPWLGKGNFSMWQPQLESCAYLIGRVQELTGTAYRMTPGVVGSAMLQDQWEGPEPRWAPDWTGCDPAHDHVTEQAYNKWTPADAPKGTHLHRWDSHRNYLGAAGVSEVSFGPLHRSPLKDFDRKRAGYWHVVVPAWNDARMPHPMGPDRQTGQTMWTTTPTMVLMEDLAGQGFLEMPTVLDSWLSELPGRMVRGRPAGPPVRRILRTWSERIDRAADHATLEPVADDAVLLEDTMKALYKESLGMWTTLSGRVRRVDWTHTAIGKARTNTWRRAWAVAQATGRYPARINTDEITYASNDPNPYDDIPYKFKTTQPGMRPRLGMVKVPESILAADAT